MAVVNLQGYKVDKIDFVNTTENGTKISLGNKFSYQVQYAANQNLAKGTFDIEVHDKENPERFKIHVIIVGIFGYNANEKKELIHTETFKALFPYAKALITTVTANCGIQPVIISAEAKQDNVDPVRKIRRSRFFCKYCHSHEHGKHQYQGSHDTQDFLHSFLFLSQ